MEENYVDDEVIFQKNITNKIKFFFETNTLDNIKNLENIDHYYNKVFILFCKNDKYLPILKYIYSNFDVNLLYKYQYESSLDIACYNSSIEIIKWLFELIVSTSKYLDYYKDKNNKDLTISFSYSLDNLNFEIIKYIYYISKEYNLFLDIHADQEEPFRYICMSDRLDIAKWLVSVEKIDLYAVREYELENIREDCEGIFYTKALTDSTCIEAYESGCEKIAEWIIRIGYKPDKKYLKHEIYEYWQKYTLKYIYGIFALIKLQKIWKMKLYNPNNGFLMLKAKESFEKNQKNNY